MGRPCTRIDFVPPTLTVGRLRELTAVCRAGLVADECLAYAMADESLVGISGTSDCAARRASTDTSGGSLIPPCSSEGTTAPTA